MTNQDNAFTNGPVTLGSPTLTINPPVKPAETVSQAEPKEKPDDDGDAASRNEE